MDKLSVLKGLVVFLVALNIGLLSFVFFNKPPQMPKGNVKDHFGFSKEQMVEFEKSRDRIRGPLDELNGQLAQLSKAYYLSEMDSDSLLNQIQEVNRRIYKVHFQHFKDIENLCNAEQMQYLEEFVNVLMRGGKPRPKRPR